MDRYINPFTDYGFKKLFATEANKDILISFLNAIIEDHKDPVVDLVYKNVEQIGEFNGTRANYFDVYCETQNGRQFIVEMQNSWKPFFKERTIYYAAKPIRDQGARETENGTPNGSPTEWEVKRKTESGKHKAVKKSDEEPTWEYRLKDVYLIAIMNFTFPRKEYKPDNFYHKIMLSDIDDHHVFYDKLTLIYVEMPKLKHVELNLDNPRDKWLYALYHLWAYDSYPEELPDEVFQKFYRQAEYANFTSDQQLEYERSQKLYRDTIEEIRGGRLLGLEEGFLEGHEEGFAEGHEKGLAEGHEKGLAEGRELERKTLIEKLKAAGMKQDAIDEILRS
jgi:hypothetical protein